jgi:hypothetical protein
MAFVLLVGLLAGYAAASGQFNPFQKADARPNEQPSAPNGAAGELAPARGRADDAGKGDALLAAHNRAVKEKSAESGKKPNILVLWGDDIGYWNLSAYNRGTPACRTSASAASSHGTREKARRTLRHRVDAQLFARLEGSDVSQLKSADGGDPRRRPPARLRGRVGKTKPLLTGRGELGRSAVGGRESGRPRPRVQACLL